MQIDKTLFDEKNYTGTRLIEIKDEKVIELKAELKKLQEEANPYLKEMEALTPKLDPFYTKLRELQDELKKTQIEMAPTKEEYDGWLAKVEKIDQKAQLIKNKMQPIVNKLIEPELGEFDRAAHLIEKDGVIYAEVIDELEEKVKAIRAAKAKK